jgi:choline dehydrogenase-like flavoprotein
MADHYDVVIVGSGAGGGSLAHRLAPFGKRVLILERGDGLPREVENWDAQAVFVDNRYVSTDAWRRPRSSGPGAAPSLPSSPTSTASRHASPVTSSSYRPVRSTQVGRNYLFHNSRAFRRRRRARRRLLALGRGPAGSGQPSDPRRRRQRRTQLHPEQPGADGAALPPGQEAPQPLGHAPTPLDPARRCRPDRARPGASWQASWGLRPESS